MLWPVGSGASGRMKREAGGTSRRIRRCPAAVSGNEVAHTHWGGGPGKRRRVGGTRHCPIRVHESEDLPTAARCTPRGAGRGISGGRWLVTRRRPAAIVACASRSLRRRLSHRPWLQRPLSTRRGSDDDRCAITEPPMSHDTLAEPVVAPASRRTRVRPHAAAHRHHHARDQAQRRARAGRRQQDRARGEPLLRRPRTRSIRCAWRPRRSAASTTARRRASWTSCRSRPRRRSSSRSRSTRGWPRACSPATSTRRSRGQEIHAFSQSIARGHDSA